MSEDPPDREHADRSVWPGPGWSWIGDRWRYIAAAGGSPGEPGKGGVPDVASGSPCGWESGKRAGLIPQDATTGEGQPR